MNICYPFSFLSMFTILILRNTDETRPDSVVQSAVPTPEAIETRAFDTSSGVWIDENTVENRITNPTSVPIIPIESWVSEINQSGFVSTDLFLNVKYPMMIDVATWIPKITNDNHVTSLI